VRLQALHTGIFSAELVLGNPLTLPGEFLDSTEQPPVNFNSTYVRLLCLFFNAAIVLCCCGCSSILFSAASQTCPCLPRWCSTVTFATISWTLSGLVDSLNHFCLDIGGRQETVSVDCLKLLLRSAPLLPAAPVPCGRSPGQPPSSLSADGSSTPPSLGGGAMWQPIF
jgi:hypothetical protein